jgi:hypothetical protein
MSAARLAAEAAFGDRPQRTAPPNPALVIVRRARLAVDAGTAAASDDTRPATQPQPVDKSPRVFRVDAAPSPKPPDLPALDLVPPALTGQAVAAGARPRRTAAHKRPGPVLHVVHTLPARRPEVEAPATDLAALAAALDRVGLVLADIGRAQSFRVIDDHRSASWQQLSLQADAIRAELGSLRPWFDRPEAYAPT